MPVSGWSLQRGSRTSRHQRREPKSKSGRTSPAQPSPAQPSPPGPAMCGYYLLELLGYLPGPSAQGHIAGWFIVFSQWLFFPEALLLRQVALECCWQLPPVQWDDALRLAERQLEAIMGVPRTRFRSARQSSLAWRMWFVGRDLRLFPQCREAACIAAYCTQVVRQLAGSPNASVAAVSSLDTYGWDVSIARIPLSASLAPLPQPEEYYDHVRARVSVAPRSVGLHTRRQLQDAFADLPLQLPTWLDGPLHLRPELLPLWACLTAWFQAKPSVCP